MNLLTQHIEALIFCSEQSISLDEITASLEISFGWEPSEAEMLASIEEIRARYTADEFAFELVEVSGGYVFLTKKTFFPTVSALIQHKAKKKLSVAQMETLSIIAYKQPVTKSEVEHIRGVNCDYAMQKLLEKELIEISGKSEGAGRPILYSTSRTFMDYFGLRSVKDLPQLKDLHMEQNEIGQASDLLDAGPGFIAEPEGAHAFPEVPEEVQERAEVIEDQQQNLGEDEHQPGIPEVIAASEEIVIDEETNGAISKDEEEIDSLPDRKTIFIKNESAEFPGTEELKSDEEDQETFFN